MSVTQIISPVDGSVYAERAVAEDAAVDRAFARARQAQSDWRHCRLPNAAPIAHKQSMPCSPWAMK